MSVAAGRLRERVLLQSPPSAPDGSGGQTGNWTTAATLNAEVVALTGAEDITAGVIASEVRYRVTMKKRAITTGQRLLWGTLALDVRAQLPSTDRGFMTLLCIGVLA